ncbi:MAG: DUF3096 domain-containing protein [Candidatus Aenigmarchaeota archaeon]|nr:DUF3096 domain-containing protein [Candidatus Aenigmarchaeota archaeon]
MAKEGKEAKKIWPIIMIILGIVILVRPEVLLYIVALFLIVKGALDLAE